MKGSRVAAVLSVVFVGAVLPAAARGAGFTYLTTYTGTYTFTQNFLAEIGKPDGSETRQTYRWSTFDYDSVTTHPGHVYTTGARGTSRRAASTRR